MSASAPLRLFLCGDVMTGRGIDQVMPYRSDPTLHEAWMKSAEHYVEIAEKKHGRIRQPVSHAYVWGDALEELHRRDPDVSVINLETSITTSDDYWKGKGIHYRMHPKNISCLTAARIDVCALANNHVLDWGYAGLTETLDVLRNAGIRSVGAGRHLAAAEAPAAVQAFGKGRVVVYSFGMPSSGIPREWAAAEDKAGVSLLDGPTPRNLRKVAAKIEGEKQDGDVLVLSIHWGGNWGYDVPRRHLEFARALVEEAGVDVVHGHSSHHVKGVDVHRGRLILYGAGDFINDYEGIEGYEKYRGDLVLMYFADLEPTSGRLLSLRMVPMRMRRLRLTRASEREAAWLRDLLRREGRRFGTSADMSSERTLILRWQ